MPASASPDLQRGSGRGSGQPQLPDDLLSWMEEAGQGRVVLAERQPGGGRKQAWTIDLRRGDGSTEPLFLRYDPSDPARTHDPWTVHREATIYQALAGRGVPVPRVWAVHPIIQAMLCQRMAGQNRFSAIADPVEREETERDFIEKLAALHRIDVATLDIPGFPSTMTLSEAVDGQLEEMRRVLQGRGGSIDPALTFTLDWLRRHKPSYGGPPVLVQGDTGPGNFMFSHGRVVAVVDWELAHFGDPMDDVAWLTLRCTQEPLGDLPARLREYERLSGNAIDQERVQYYQVMAEAKLQVMAHRASTAPPTPDRADVGNAIIYRILHRRLWLEALAGAMGLRLAGIDPTPEEEESPRRWMYDSILNQLREVIVPRSGDPMAKAQGKGVARMVKYLAEFDSHGRFYESSELAELEGLLRTRPADLATGRRLVTEAASEGRLSIEDYVTCLWRRAARENELAKPAMGVLAGRRWPSLR